MKPAYAPWAELDTATGTAQLVCAATLAANAHDAQPWTFRVDGDRIEIYPDTERNLGTFDPFRRELYQSLGCATENIAVAAHAQGRDAVIEVAPGRLPPDGADGPAVVVQIGDAVERRSHVLDAIRARCTHRGAYRKQPIPDAVFAELRDIAAATDVRLLMFTGDDREPLGARIVAATEQIVADPTMAADNARWFRFRERDVEAHRDGLTLDANVVEEPLHVLAKLFPPSAKRANAKWIQDTRNIHVGTAAVLGILAVRDPYDCATAITVGRLWQRFHLHLTTRGIAAQPLNQAVEIVDRRRQLGAEVNAAEDLRRFTGDPAWQATFMFRAGYPKRTARHSPRRPLGDVLRR